MALPWVKLHVSLIDNDVFKRLSRGAKLTFYTAIALAAKQDQDGALALRTGPMTIGEIAYYTGLSDKQQTESLTELKTAGFMSQRLDSSYVVERWKEKVGDISTPRVKRLRERSRNPDETLHETLQERKCNAVDKEEDKDIDPDSLRSSALGFGDWPETTEGLRALAALFLAAFGNCRDPEKAEKNLPDYAQTLAQMRSRGVTIAVAWQACADAREVNDRPLFGAKIKSAMSFLPAKPQGPPRRNLRVVNAEDIEAMP